MKKLVILLVSLVIISACKNDNPVDVKVESELKITKINPLVQIPESDVFIYLLNFNPELPLKVYFNSVEVLIRSKGDNYVKVQVPAGMLGKINIKVISGDQTVSDNGNLNIIAYKVAGTFATLGIIPDSAKTGDTIRVSWQSYLVDLTKVVVHIGNYPATIISINDSIINVIVPDLKVIGDYFVTIILGSQSSSSPVNLKFRKVSLINEFATVTLNFSNLIIERTFKGFYSHYPYGSGSETKIDTLLTNYNITLNLNDPSFLNWSKGDSINYFYPPIIQNIEKYFYCIINKSAMQLEHAYFDTNFLSQYNNGIKDFTNQKCSIQNMKYQLNADGNYIAIIEHPDNRILQNNFQWYSRYTYNYGNEYNEQNTDYKILSTTDSSKITLTLVPKK